LATVLLSVCAPRTAVAQHDSLVAEATMHTVQMGRAVAEYIYLPVTIHGHTGTAVLDLGADIGLAYRRSTAASAGLGVQVQQLDSIAAMMRAGHPLSQEQLVQKAQRASVLDSMTIGTAVARQIPVAPLELTIPVPPGMPPYVGILGTQVLRRYDLLVDGPAQRVQLYAPGRQSLASPGAAPPWLPAGLSAADCMPMPPTTGRGGGSGFVTLPLQVDGHAVQGYFDSGSPHTIMNMAAGRLLGLTQHAPNVHLIPDSLAGVYPHGGGRDKYLVTGLTLQVGTHALTALPVRIATRIPSGVSDSMPQLLLGLDALRDRLLFISYATGQVCLSAARPASPPSSPMRPRHAR
jgi:hypothetical protein